MRGQGDFGERIVVAVGAAVLDNSGRVLLIKHVEAKRGGFWFGKWICPGGMLKPGETILNGVLREVKEETSLDIKTSGRAIASDRIVKEQSKTKLHVIYIDFMAKVEGGKLRASSDAGVARWFTQEELAERWSELHEDTQRLLKEAGIVKENIQAIV